MDFSRYLPLSGRERRDESDVTGDWSTHVAAVLAEFAEVVERLTLSQWAGDSLRKQFSVAEVVATAISELHPRGERDVVALDRDASAAELRRLAREFAASTHKTRVAALTTALVAALDVSVATGEPLSVDGRATGAVAVARAASAPLGIRAILRDHRLVAVDADWNVGAGHKVESTATAIILFLFERSGLPDGARA